MYTTVLAIQTPAQFHPLQLVMFPAAHLRTQPPDTLEEENLACLDVEWWVCCMQTLHPALELDIIILVCFTIHLNTICNTTLSVYTGVVCVPNIMTCSMKSG